MPRTTPVRVVVEGWTYPTQDRGLAISPERPRAGLHHALLPSRHLNLVASDIPSFVAIRAIGTIARDSLEIEDWHAIDNFALPNFLEEHRSLVHQVADSLRSESSDGSSPGGLLDSELDAFAHVLEKRDDVTMTKMVYAGGIRRYVVVTLRPENIRALIQSSDFRSRILIRRARWTLKEIQYAEDLIRRLDEESIINVSGGVSSNGDYAIKVLLLSEQEDFINAVETLPQGLISVSTWLQKIA